MSVAHPDLRFKHSRLIEELAEAHPLLRRQLIRLAVWSRENGVPAPMVTCIRRDEASNEAVGGAKRSLHLCLCAGDLRITHYSPDERRRVGQWLISNCPPDVFELVLIPHGTAPHFHVAVRDRNWKGSPNPNT
jgi:hypothetical protein